MRVVKKGGYNGAVAETGGGCSGQEAPESVAEEETRQERESRAVQEEPVGVPVHHGRRGVDRTAFGNVSGVESLGGSS